MQINWYIVCSFDFSFLFPTDKLIINLLIYAKLEDIKMKNRKKCVSVHFCEFLVKLFVTKYTIEIIYINMVEWTEKKKRT